MVVLSYSSLNLGEYVLQALPNSRRVVDQVMSLLTVLICDQIPEFEWDINFTFNACFFVSQDPAVTQHSSNTEYATLDLYNPFDNKTGVRLCVWFLWTFVCSHMFVCKLQKMTFY